MLVDAASDRIPLVNMKPQAERRLGDGNVACERIEAGEVVAKTDGYDMEAHGFALAGVASSGRAPASPVGADYAGFEQSTVDWISAALGPPAGWRVSRRRWHRARVRRDSDPWNVGPRSLFDWFAPRIWLLRLKAWLVWKSPTQMS
jgi:hypothetical protein